MAREAARRARPEIIDASWYLLAQEHDARAEYEAAHIPGARFLDQDAISDPDSGLPHTLLSPQDFAQYVGGMGVSADATIVIYDGPGYFSAPRGWWMFRLMGVFQCLYTEGRFRPLEGQGTSGDGGADEDRALYISRRLRCCSSRRPTRMRRIVDKRESQIAHARSADRFAGTGPEPRTGIRSGHMPGARNIPVTALAENGELLPEDRLRKVIEDVGIDLSKPVVTSCGSGITAAAISLALETLGHADNRLYDGSWTEWRGLADTPVVTGKE